MALPVGAVASIFNEGMSPMADILIWRVRYSVDGYPGHTDQYFLDEKRAMREGKEFTEAGADAQALILQITVYD